MDNAFSGDGRLMIASGSEPKATAVAVQSDGKALMAGTSKLPGTRVASLYRYNADGSADLTFSGDGVTAVPGMMKST